MFFRSQVILGSIVAVMLSGQAVWSAPFRSRLPATPAILPVRSTGGTSFVHTPNPVNAAQRAYYQAAFNNQRAIVNNESAVARNAFRSANNSLYWSHYPYSYNPYAYNPYAYNPYSYNNPYTYNPYSYTPAVTTPYTYNNTYVNYSAPYASGSSTGGAYDRSNPYASAMAFGNTPGPDSAYNNGATAAPATSQAKPLPSPLAAFGIPNEKGAVKWPVAFRLLPEKQRESLQKIDSQLQFATTQAIVGKANPLLLKETTKELDQLRQGLRERQNTMAEVTYREATAFLRKLEEALDTMAGS